MKENKLNIGDYLVIVTFHSNKKPDIFRTYSREEAECERARLIDMADEYDYASVRLVQLLSEHEQDRSDEFWIGD